MAVSNVSQAAAATSSGSSSAASSSSGITGSKEIAGNFQDFLLLLTTQLKNQSPLDPLDTNQFTQQLVQFAGVEQQLKSNDTLSSILSAMKTTSTANAASYIGLQVTADGSKAELSGSGASWTVTSPKAAAKATITVKDSSGTTVATLNQQLAAGTQAISWDGKDSTGNVRSSGTYTISVNASDASGQSVAASTDVAGTVTAVDVSGASPMLTVGSQTVPLSSVKTVAYK